jgi:Na+/melibiose symporter-like transporter
MVVYVAHFISLDMLWVPYFALGPEMTPDTKDQGAMYAVMRGTEIVGIGAGVIGPGLFVALGFTTISGNFILSVIVAVYLIATLWLLVFTTKERIGTKEDKPQRPMVQWCRATCSRLSQVGRSSWTS